MPFGNAVGEGFVNGEITKLTISDLGPGDGFFIYTTSTPSFQKLIATITAMAGTDGASNPYEEGITAYVYRAGVAYAVQIGEVTIGGVNYPGLFMQNLASQPTIPAAIVANSSASGSTLQVYSGESVGGAQTAEVLVQDSVAAGIANGGVTIVAGNVSLDISGNLTINNLNTSTINGSSLTGVGDNGGVTSGPSGTVSSFPAAGPNHTHAEIHHHSI